MQENRKQFPFAMTLKALIIYIISIIIMGLPLEQVTFTASQKRRYLL